MWSPLALSPPRSVAPGGDELAATSRRGSAAPGRRRRAAAARAAATRSSISSSVTPRGPGRQRRRCRRRSPRPVRQKPLRGLVGDLGGLLRRSSAGAGRSSAGSPPAGGRARRAPRPAPRAPRRGRRAFSPMPDEDAARERDPQLAGGADRRPAARPGPSSASPGGRRGRRGRDSSIRPCEAVTSRSRARSSRPSDAEVRVRQQPALERALARPHDVGDEVLVAPAPQARARRSG